MYYDNGGRGSGVCQVRDRGAILLNALILLAVMMIVLSSLFESTILQIKMTANFKHGSEARMEAERLQQVLEKKMEHTGECHSSECKLIQFIPDAFMQWERTGVNYYRLTGLMQSTYARRQSNPLSPLGTDFIELNEFVGYPVVGSDPIHQGHRVYVTDGGMLNAYQVLPHSLPRLIYSIDEKTPLSVSTLWHEYLIVDKPLENNVALFDAYTGKKLQEIALKAIAPTSDSPECTLSPVVLVKASRERKRTLIISREDGFYMAEMEIDYERLGRRTTLLCLL